jgi:hypothetical protein
MIRSLKAAFGLSLIAALVLSAMSVMGASAKNPEANNHFSSSSINTKYKVIETTGTAHSIKLSAFGGSVECHSPKYAVTNTTATKFTTITVTPTEEPTWNCTSGEHKATVNFNGCHYQFTAKASTATHATVHFLCPTGKKAEVVAENTCTEKFGAQTPTTNGVTYTNINKHITVNVTVEGIHAEGHGVCQIFGTNTLTAKMNGATTVEGFDVGTGVKATISAT